MCLIGDGWERDRSAEPLDEDLGVPAGGIVALATGRGQVIGCGFLEAGLVLEPREGLGGQGEDLVEAEFAGAGLDVLDEFGADALIFVGGTDEEEGEFALFVFGIGVEGDAADGILVDLEQVIVADLTFDADPGTFDEFSGGHGGLGEVEEGADVLFEGAPDLGVFVGVDEGSDAFVGEDFGEETFIDATVDDVDAGNAVFAGEHGMAGLGQGFGSEFGLVLFEEGLEFGDGKLPEQPFLPVQSVRRGDEDHFRRPQLGGEGGCDGVGVDAVGLAIAIEAEGRNDRDDALGDEALEQFGVDPFDLAGELVIDPADDAEGMGDDGVGGGGAEIVGAEAFEDFVGETIGGGEGNLERGGIGDAGAVEIGRGDAAFGGEGGDLEGGAVDQDDPDVQRPQDGDVEEQVGKVVVGDDGSIDGDDEGLFAEPGDVAEDAAEVSWLHAGRSFFMLPATTKETRVGGKIEIPGRSGCSTF